jgi:hypothetical protein
VTLDGVIASFSDARGDGTFVSDDHEVFYFHCVEILDGSRTISEGTRARATRAVGRLGRDEVVRVEKL